MDSTLFGFGDFEHFWCRSISLGWFLPSEQVFFDWCGPCGSRLGGGGDDDGWRMSSSSACLIISSVFVLIWSFVIWAFLFLFCLFLTSLGSLVLGPIVFGLSLL